jgi:4-amino-4-deoxy-L-arabinose transferase-like glycosyltransferase
MPDHPMPPTPVWARPPFVFSAIAVYLAVHFAVRMAMWHTLGIDDAEQALFSQQFAWSYRNSAPPLFTWLLLGLGKAMGVDIVSISLIRYALLAIVYVFAYLTARRLIADPRLAALSLYSFAAIYVFAFYSHHDLTHTTALAAMLALAWYVFVRLVNAPRLGWYLALGAVFGLGLLGKWNFAMLAAALPLACLARREYRAMVLTWKIVPAVVVCGLIVLPTALAILFSGTTDKDTFHSVLIGDQAAYMARVAEGTWRLIRSAILYPQPLLVLLILVFALPLWRGVRRPEPAGAPAPRPDMAFLWWTMAISLALHMAMVLGFGARIFSERLMQPPLFILPIALFMLIERGKPSARAVNAFALVLALLVAGTLAARIVVYLRGADHCGSCRAMMPVEALASQLREAGYDGSGTILVEGFHVGGNMRVAFPAARVMDAGFPPRTWPEPQGSGQCLLLWNDRGDPARSDAARDWLSYYLTEKLHEDGDAPHRDGVASALMFGSETRAYRLGYRLYEEPVGDCR